MNTRPLPPFSNRFRTVLTLLLGLSLLTGIHPMEAQAAGESFVYEGASGWISRSVAIDLQINGSDNATLELNLLVPSGTLSFGTTADVSFTGPNSGASIKMSGTREDINAVLDTMTYTRSSAATVTLDAWLGVGGGDFAYNEETQHVYQVVAATSTWSQAKDAAEASDFQGIPGYLATITTQQEHDFIRARITDDGWIGGSDAAVENEWRWETGPETGIQFWQGTASSTGGVPVGGMFTYWANNEPNNNTSGNSEGEDCAEIRFSSGNLGRWNDLPCDAERPNYVVEFGTPGNLPVIVASSLDIVVTAVPDGVLALEKIQEYADTDGGSTAPTVQDYEDAGINGVTADNLAEVNGTIAETDPAELADSAALQNAVIPAIAYDVIDTYADSNGETTAPTVQDYLDAGIDGVTADNLEEVNAALAANGGAADPDELASIIAEAVKDAKNDGSSRRSGGSVQSRVKALEANGNAARAAELKNEYAHLFGDGSLASLQATLATLQAQLAALTSGALAPIGVRDLELGLEGEDVRKLQELLIGAGHAIPAGATGYFGEQTQTALAAYQAANGIAPAAGYFGAVTRAQMKGAGKGW